MHDGRRDGEPNGVARLERVLFSNVAYLVDVRLDEFQTVSVDRPTPLFELVLNTASGCPDPLQLEVEAGGRVVDDIVVQDDGFGLVAFLRCLLNDQKNQAARRHTLFPSISMINP
jgi:hypothetical protein